MSFREDEIQKRSYPNSFGGQHQLKGYELIHELALLDARARASPNRPWRCTRPISAPKAASI